MVFATITGSLVLGAAIEKGRIFPFMIFISLWLLFIYSPIACWVWNVNGWAYKWGVLDFAGGAPVEVCSGFSVLGADMAIGHRRENKKSTAPCNLPLFFIGCAILWFGWVGFDSGSADGAGAVATYCFINTNMAAGAGAIAAITMDYFAFNSFKITKIAEGAIAGMVAITPSCGYIEPWAAIICGFAAGSASFWFMWWDIEENFCDDSVDALGCHGIGGIVGYLMIGLFATTEINPQGNNGLFYGNPK